MAKGPKPLPKVRRMLNAKVIGFKSGRRKAFAPPRVDELVRQIVLASPTIAGRHIPTAATVEVGRQCAFINRAVDYGAGGVLFEVCTYVKGHVPESMIPDLSAASANITPIELKDTDGNDGELVHVFRCIVLGQTMVMEAVRGVGNASVVVQSLLTVLTRRHTPDKSHPSFVLVDILADDLKEMIKAKGGVVRVSAKLADAVSVDGSRFAELLSSTRAGMKQAATCAVTWEAAGTLDTDDAIAMLEEAEGEMLNSATLHFKKGGSISDLTTYRERTEAWVQQLSDGTLAVTEIEKAMRDYLDALRAGSSISSIQVDGTVTKIKTIGAKKK